MNQSNRPRVQFITSSGTIIVELYPDKAPLTVENFLTYIHDHFYDNTVFHRVIASFIIQGGGFETGMIQKATRAPIRNEAKHALLNARGTIAMARLPDDPHSAAAQFFINVRDNDDVLDFSEETPEGWGYCAFGKVIDGMPVVERITSVVNSTIGQHRNVPTREVVVEKAEMLS